jgi:zinc protease
MRLIHPLFPAFLSAILLALLPTLGAAQDARPAAASPEAKEPAPKDAQPPTKPPQAPESVPAGPKGEPPAPSPARPPSPPSSNVPQRAAFAVKLGSPIPVSAIRKVASVEGITEYRLPNGLKVLLFPDASKPTITVNITYQVGSRFENYGETGMAHLLEHLMFKGTPKHPHIDQEFNARGVRFNGTTWLDRTNYYDIFEASDDNLAWAIGLEADRMVSSFISRRDLASEMTVVRNEFEQGENSPFSVRLKLMQRVAYDLHSYGRSTIVNRSDI